MKIIFDDDTEMSYEEFKKKLSALLVEKFNCCVENDVPSLMDGWTDEEVIVYTLMGKCIYDILPNDVRKEIQTYAIREFFQ